MREYLVGRVTEPIIEIMWSLVKKKWREFKEGRPGHRFQERYERNRSDRGSRAWFGHYVKPIGGFILLAAGVAFCILPGPGLPLVFIGAGLLAEQFRAVAQVMDWTEVKVRKLLRWVIGWWKHAPKLERFAVLFVAACALVGAGYGAYELIAP